MIEIRFHGRGGQGAVTSAELLAVAAIEHGMYAQAFPSFGPERRGAPVVAFCRISDTPIRLRANIYEPDVVIVLDPSVLTIAHVEKGLKPDGTLICNTKYDGQHIRNLLKINQKTATVNATHIAMEILKLPITNTTMLGALIKATGLLEKDALEGPLKRRFGKIAEKNIMAYKEAYEKTTILE